MKKRLLFSLMLLLAILLTGCGNTDWKLVAEGVLTDIDTINGQTMITFDNKRAVLLGAYDLEEPTVLLFGDYYFLYKEVGRWIWSGYHLLSERR